MKIYQNKEWGEKQRERALAGMKYFDDLLAGQPFAAGEHFSMVDITLFAGLGFADFAKIGVPAECSNLVAWRQRMAERPSMKG